MTEVATITGEHVRTMRMTLRAAEAALQQGLDLVPPLTRQEDEPESTAGRFYAVQMGAVMAVATIRTALELANPATVADTNSDEAVIVGVEELDPDHVRLVIEDPA